MDEATCPEDYDEECVWQGAVWTDAGTFECEPGDRVQIDCRDCTGDPMLQVRDGERCVDDDDDACSNLCPSIAFDCPERGSADVYTAPYGSTTDYTCNWRESD